MNKNVIVSAIVILAILGIYFSIKNQPQNVDDGNSQSQMAGTVTATPTPRPKPPVTGDVFADSSIKNMAYQVFPGPLSADAMAVTKGWQIKATPQKDGSTLVDFIPSDQMDKKSSYTVKKGQTLYYVEVNPGDDSPSGDNFLQDDYGVVVGADGLVQ